ncbi:MAG: Na/Pi symporter, partial [Planctomycetota bacterium]
RIPAPEMPNDPPDKRSVHPAVRVLVLFLLLYAFLVAIKLLGLTFREFGESRAESLFSGLRTPIAGLAVGILSTVLVQSSSVTTTIIVGLVSEDQLGLDIAVFAIMGCNIGTTVTNTVVAFGHIRHDVEFRRAFAGATMHDFFNLLALLILMPLELMTGILQGSAHLVSSWVYGLAEGGKFQSPVKTMVNWAAKPLKNLVFHDLGLPEGWAVAILITLSLLTLFLALIFITRTMRALIAERMEQSLNAVLGRSGVVAILIGTLLTVAVQSSSITTSLMIPLFAAGILRLENGFPVTIGANIGTTITALIASMAGNESGLTIALVHTFFNVGATLLIFPIPAVRSVPIRCARLLAEFAIRSRIYAILFVVTVFMLVPFLVILLS